MMEYFKPFNCLFFLGVYAFIATVKMRWVKCLAMPLQFPNLCKR